MKKTMVVVALAGILSVLWCSSLFALWDPPERRSGTVDVDLNEPTYNVAASGNTVWLVWNDNRDGAQEVFYQFSTDGGATWSQDLRLTDDDDTPSYFPSVALSGSDVHIVWGDQKNYYTEVYYDYSSDGGSSWKGNTRVTTVAC